MSFFYKCKKVIKISDYIQKMYLCVNMSLYLLYMLFKKFCAILSIGYMVNLQPKKCEISIEKKKVLIFLHVGLQL